MQAKLLILFVLVAGSIVASTEGFGKPVGQGPIGKKREVHLSFVSQLQSPVVFFFFREFPEQECLLRGTAQCPLRLAYVLSGKCNF